MSALGITPGPWIVRPSLANAALILGSESCEIGFASFQQFGGEPFESQVAANAQLAAAAPELYEALEQLLAVTDDPANDADEEESVFPFARAALAKARAAQ